jgi:hypothetical protein
MMTRMILKGIAAAACFCLTVGSMGLAQEKDGSSGDDVKKHAQETFDAAKKYTLEQKDVYEKKMEAELQDLSRQIGELKDKAQTVKGEALVALEAKLGELKEKQKAAEEKLKELRSASAEAWENVKTGAEKAFQDLKKAYDLLGKVVK